MRLTIFGASGRTGAELIRQALARGDEVTVVVRRPAAFDPHVTVRVVSAAPVAPPPPDDSFVSRRIAMPIVERALRPVCEDLRAMEAALAASDSVWTAFRPPRLTNGKAKGRYRARIGASVPRGFLLTRADLATAMLNALGRPETERAAVGVAG